MILLYPLFVVMVLLLYVCLLCDCLVFDVMCVLPRCVVLFVVLRMSFAVLCCVVSCLRMFFTMLLCA